MKNYFSEWRWFIVISVVNVGEVWGWVCRLGNWNYYGFIYRVCLMFSFFRV